MAKKRTKRKTPEIQSNLRDELSKNEWDQVSEDTGILLSTTLWPGNFVIPAGDLRRALEQYATKVTKHGNIELERRVIGEERHTKLAKVEKLSEKQSQSAKDRAADRKAEADSIATEVQIAANELLAKGYGKHLVASKLTLRTWGPNKKQYKYSWIQHLLKR